MVQWLGTLRPGATQGDVCVTKRVEYCRSDLCPASHSATRWGPGKSQRYSPQAKICCKKSKFKSKFVLCLFGHPVFRAHNGGRGFGTKVRKEMPIKSQWKNRAGVTSYCVAQTVVTLIKNIKIKITKNAFFCPGFFCFGPILIA
jgi:hypothetical protein